jgi:hypothetical protein
MTDRVRKAKELSGNSGAREGSSEVDGSGRGLQRRGVRRQGRRERVRRRQGEQPSHKTRGRQMRSVGGRREIQTREGVEATRRAGQDGAASITGERAKAGDLADGHGGHAQGAGVAPKPRRGGGEGDGEGGGWEELRGRLDWGLGGEGDPPNVGSDTACVESGWMERTCDFGYQPQYGLLRAEGMHKGEEVCGSAEERRRSSVKRLAVEPNQSEVQNKCFLVSGHLKSAPC